MRKRRRDWWSVLLAVLVVAALAALWIGKQRCDKAGGTYVRGLFWMKCIQVDTLTTDKEG